MHSGVLIILALLLTSAPPAQAVQEGNRNGSGPAPQMTEQARQRFEQIKTRLALTPEQVEQVGPILIEEGQKLRALRDKHTSAGGGSRRDRLKMARELREIQGDADKQLEKVLSKQQLQELKKIREETREQIRTRAGRP